MASKVKLRMNVELLSDKEVNYELFVRGKLNKSETYYRRRRSLKNELENESICPTTITYDTSLTETKDYAGLLESFEALNDIYACEEVCDESNVKKLETLVVHLRDRMSRWIGLEHAEKFSEIRSKLQVVETEILSHYAENPDNNNNANSNDINSNQTNMNTNDIAQIIEQTVNRILEQRLPSRSSGNTPSRNQRNRNMNDDNDFEFRPRDNSSNSDWQNSDIDDFPNDRDQRTRNNNRMSSTRVPNHT